MGPVPSHAVSIRAALTATAFGAVLAAATPALAGEPAAAGPAGHAYACFQTFASYGPNGRLSGFNRAARGVLHLYDTAVPVYEVSNALGFVPKHSARTGRFAWDGRDLRFTSGPYHLPAAGWDLAGSYHPRGVRMPHDRKRGTRYELVLRSAIRHPADDAPPRRTGRDFVITPWYCDALP